MYTVGENFKKKTATGGLKRTVVDTAKIAIVAISPLK